MHVFGLGKEARVPWGTSTHEQGEHAHCMAQNILTGKVHEWKEYCTLQTHQDISVYLNP